MRFYFTLIISAIALSGAFAQDEFMLAKDSLITDFDLKIEKVNSDSLFYKSFGKHKITPLKDIIAYHKAGERWVFTNQEGHKWHTVINGKFALLYKQPDFILSPFLVQHPEHINKLPSYKIKFTLNGKEKVLKSQYDVGFTLEADSLKTFFIARLNKISSDSLFFSAKLNGEKKYWGFAINDFSSFSFETDLQKAFKYSTLALFGTVGAIAVVSVKTKIKNNESLKIEFVPAK